MTLNAAYAQVTSQPYAQLGVEGIEFLITFSGAGVEGNIPQLTVRAAAATAATCARSSRGRAQVADQSALIGDNPSVTVSTVTQGVELAGTLTLSLNDSASYPPVRGTQAHACACARRPAHAGRTNGRTDRGRAGW